MTKTRFLRTGAFALTICFAVLAGSCSGSSTGSSATTQAPAPIPDSGVSPATAAPLHSMGSSTGMATEGSPVIKGVRASVADACVDGRAVVTVTSEVATVPSIRVMTLIAGGEQTAVNPVEGQELVVQNGSLPCDGSSTMLLVIATDFDAQSSTQAVAAKSPLAP
jgi:hypothetical protein